MILLINTAASLVTVSIIDDVERHDYEWQADRTLAKDLLSYLDKLLKSHNLNWASIRGIGVFKGPGSFTGLRIGLTVMNTLADARAIPIVGAVGDNWRNEAVDKLNAGQNDKIVLPFYGGEANITAPRK